MIAACAALSALACASSPALAAPATIGQGVNPRVAVTPGGTGHVVWSIPARGVANAAVGYCRLPPGGTGCDRAETLFFPSNRGLAKSGGDATVQVEGDGIVRIVSACYTCASGDAQEGIVRWTSVDGGATFSAEPSLGGTPTNAGMGPDGVTLPGGVYLTPADGDKVIARPGTADTALVDMAVGDAFVSSPSLVQVPAQPKVVYATSDLFGIRTAVYTGGDLSAGALMDPARWIVDQPLPSPEPGIRDPRLSAGPGGVWLSYDQQQPLDDHVLVRRFDPVKNTFGAARSVEAAAEIDSGVADASSGQDATGRLHVVWRTDLQQKLLRYTRSDPGGGTFGAPATLAEGESFVNPEVAAGPSGAGWVVWQADDDSPIRVLPVNDPAGDGAAAPAAATTRTVAVTASGARISLQLPAGCVKRGGTFRARLTWKKQKKKGNLFVKITRVDFTIGKARAKIDRRAPFTQTLRIASTAAKGKTVTFRARAFIKVKKGKSPKKSIRATIRVCA